MKNRVIAVVLAVMVAGTLTACSGSGTKETQPATQATTQAKETQAPETQAKETQAAETQAAETEAKTTEAKETEAKATEAKETEAAATEAEETEAKTTEAKETEAKETEAAATEAEETEAKATEAAGSETEAEAEIPAEAVYTLVNNTGLEVTGIKFYQNDIKKIVVTDNEPLEDGDSTVIKIEKDDTITADTRYTISYQTAAVDEDHQPQPHVYKNLGYETVQLNLLAPDAITGATPFEFAEPGTSETEAETEATASETEAETERPLPDKAIYQFNNVTGEDVTELTVTDNATKKVVFEIKKALADKESTVFSIDKDDTITNDTSYTISFKTKSGYEGEFKTLHFEQASINLIAEDAKSGATAIEFTYDAPETEAETEA